MNARAYRAFDILFFDRLCWIFRNEKGILLFSQYTSFSVSGISVQYCILYLGRNTAICLKWGPHGRRPPTL